MVLLQPAYVLHQRPYRETSSLIEIYAEHAGRLGLIAKGARRPRSPFRGLLQPFVPLLLSWSGRGELGTLTGAEFAHLQHEVGKPPGASGGQASGQLHGAQIFQAMYLNELLMRLLHRHDPHPELFAIYARTLEALAAAPRRGSEAVLRRFEVTLLEAIGYGMVLGHDAQTGQPIDPTRRYRYLFERGPVAESLWDDEADGVNLGEANDDGHWRSGNLARGVRVDQETGLTVSGRTLAWLGGAMDEDPDTPQQAKQLMRFVLRPLLGERPLATRSLFVGPRQPGSDRSA